MRRAVFLDRDGTLIEPIGFRSALFPKEVRLMEGVVEGLKLLKKAGLLLVVTTNQSRIEAGTLKLETLHAIHAEMKDQILAADGPMIDAIYWCPHMPVRGKNKRQCYCRKPAPGMILDAAKHLKIDIEKSYMIGDVVADMEAGFLAGVAGNFLIDKDIEHEYSYPIDPVNVVSNGDVHVRQTFLKAAENVVDLASSTPKDLR